MNNIALILMCNIFFCAVTVIIVLWIIKLTQPKPDKYLEGLKKNLTFIDESAPVSQKAFNELSGRQEPVKDEKKKAFRGGVKHLTPENEYDTVGEDA